MLGVFDSGLGGISIWKEIVKSLPNEDVIYVADSGNCPYGAKPQEEIQRLSERITGFLLEKGCSAIVIACNTATAAAIDYLRKKYDVPIIGIEPAVKPAAKRTKTGVIGILATKGTFDGRLFKKTKEQYANHIKVLIQIGTGLVEIVENNLIEEQASYDLIQKYIEPMLEINADQIVLGCTHYPFLTEIINQIANGKATAINPAPAVARQTKRILKKYDLISNNDDLPQYQFYTSGSKRILAGFLKKHTTLPYQIFEIEK